MCKSVTKCVKKLKATYRQTLLQIVDHPSDYNTALLLVDLLEAWKIVHAMDDHLNTLRVAVATLYKVNFPSTLCLCPRNNFTRCQLKPKNLNRGKSLHLDFAPKKLKCL